MSTEPLRVLIVDDSRIFRGVMEESLARVPDVKVVGSVWSGEKALDFVRQNPTDLVTLDIQMPGLGGLDTLKALRAQNALKRPLGVLLISAFTRQGAAITVEGLEEGAFDFITKPDGPDAQANAVALAEQLREKIDAYRSGRGRRVPARPASSPAPAPTEGRLAPQAPAPQTQAPQAPPTVPRTVSRYRALVIGASTGGPEALVRLLPNVAPDCPVPMFLTQHMPAGFTDYFATSLAQRCRSKVVEAREGMIAEPRVLYVAPGGRHMVVNRREGQVLVGLSDSPPENGCRPAADVLFRSAAVAYPGGVLAVVLTGMGCDGAKGAVVLKRAGAQVIVQDEATSVVWGMPGSTVAAGAADEILPIDQIGSAIRAHLGMRGA